MLNMWHDGRMRVTVTGATGLIGTRLVGALRERGDEVTVLSRAPDRAAATLGVEAIGWDPAAEPAPSAALAGRDAVLHLAGEPIDQRWTTDAKQRIRASREQGTARLVEGLRAADPRPPALVCASAVGYYGPRGDEELDETAPAGAGFLADVCRAWERSAAPAVALDMRVAWLRTGVLLDRSGGALARMLPPFRAGLGGPIAGGGQYVSWIAPDDLVAMYLAAVDDEAWRGAINASAPEPVTNRALSRALGRVLRRPAVLPVPAIALRALYGEMSVVVTTGQRAVPARAGELGFAFGHGTIDGALRAALTP
jgi:uncharacterized protein (TIGR01777 family)